MKNATIVQTKVQKWGNGLAIRISGVMRDIPHFSVNMPIEVEVSDEGLKIKKCLPKKCLKLPFTEKILLKDMTPQKAHADLIATPLDSEF